MAPRPDLEKVREIVRRSRAEQGLSPTIKDPIVLNRVAAIFRLPDSQVLEVGMSDEQWTEPKVHTVTNPGAKTPPPPPEPEDVEGGESE